MGNLDRGGTGGGAWRLVAAGPARPTQISDSRRAQRLPLATQRRAAARHGLGAGRQFCFWRYGLPRRKPGAPSHCAGFLDGPNRGDQCRIRPLCAGHRLCHHRRAPGGQHIAPRAAAQHAATRRGGVHQPDRAAPGWRPTPMVAVPARRQLAPPSRARQLHRRARDLPGGCCHPR